MNCELNERLKVFLRDPQRKELRFRDGEWEKLLIRCPYDDETDFLYLATAYKGRSPHQIGEDAKYAGIYSRLRDCLSDVCYDLADIAEDHVIGKAALLGEISDTASAKVLEIVGGQPVEETEDAERHWITKEYFLKYELERQALQHFYNRTQPEFTPRVNVESMTTEEYIHALNHPKEGAERLARAYVRSKAIYINRKLWEIPLIAKRLKVLEATPGEHHLRRRIAESIGEEKMVRLDLNKNGQQLSVRIEASELKRTEGSAYSTYRMDALGRRAFVAAFEHGEDLRADDIVQISYGRRVLYQKLQQIYT